MLFLIINTRVAKGPFLVRNCGLSNGKLGDNIDVEQKHKRDV